MNTYKIGRDFEIEALVYLKNKFKQAIWLSKNKKPVFDFVCEDENGEVYFGDAKVVANNSKPLLSYNQKSADFVIFKKRGSINFIWKSNFKNNIAVDKGESCLIRISEETKESLDNLKVQPRETYSEVISRIIGGPK